MHCHYIAVIFPLKAKDRVPYFEQYLFCTAEFTFPNNTLCQVMLKSAQWFWRRRYLKVVNAFNLCHCYLPLGKKRDPFLKYN